MRLQFWSLENVEYTFIAITLRSTLTQNVCTYQGPISESKRTIIIISYLKPYSFVKVICIW